ncbi:PaaI family thioesterase [Fretibacter rubidus]|uniref:PaaI family thioesterase n=1 Tax=Fretibacter rubidus TaxID=570162 RepID=UPI00352ACA18
MTSDTLITRALEAVPYAQTLGAKPIFIGEELTLILPYSADNIGNPVLPALHGGAIGGFMELAAIAELIHSASEEDLSNLPKPIGINIDYLRRGRPVDTYARAAVFKRGSRVVNVRVRAWQEDYDNPIAALHGNFLIPSDG